MFTLYWLARQHCICNTNSASSDLWFVITLLKAACRALASGTVHREAGALGLHGWVRNTEDGHVEVVASGDAEDLGLLLEALHKGSRGSRVDAVVEHDLADSEERDFGHFRSMARGEEWGSARGSNFRIKGAVNFGTSSTH